MDSVVEAAIRLIESIGEVGVGLLIALETVVPPIPSEVVLPFAGFAAAQGVINPWLAWLAATLGALAGAYLLYGLGVLLSYERLHDLAGRRLVPAVQSARPRAWAPPLPGARRGAGARRAVRPAHPLHRLGPRRADRHALWRFTLLTVAGSGVWAACSSTSATGCRRTTQQWSGMPRPSAGQWLPWHCSRWCGWPFAESASAGGARTPLRPPSRRPHRPRAATADHPGGGPALTVQSPGPQIRGTQRPAEPPRG